MTFKTVFFTLLASTIVLATMATVPASENKGADQITIYGGSRGDVPFPHHLHQDTLKDCKTCHDAFPQEKGAIEAMKQSGTLKRKHVMNKLCTSCHKERKKAGEKTGPTSCKLCHSVKN